MTDEPEVSSDAAQSDISYGGTSVVETSTTTTSRQNPYAYFLIIIWIMLLLFIIVLVTLVVDNTCGRGRQQVEHADVEATENFKTNDSPRREKTKQRVSLIILYLGSAIALSLSIVSILSCNFLDLDENIIFKNLLSNGKIIDRVEVYSLGLWGVGLSSGPEYLNGQQNEGCFNTSALFSLDWQFELSRASAVISSFVGGLCLVTLIALGFANAKFRGLIRYLVWPFLAATIFEFLTLSLLGSPYCDYICEISFGAPIAITSALYWLFCACVTALIPFETIKV